MNYKYELRCDYCDTRIGSSLVEVTASGGRIDNNNLTCKRCNDMHNNYLERKKKELKNISSGDIFNREYKQEWVDDTRTS